MSSKESDQMLKLLENLSDEELAEMLAAQEELEKKLNETGPQNDDELHEWIKYELGIDIPRTAVCENHQAPFSFLADLYFDRIDAALAVANRGGAKTFMVAVLHWLNARFKPGIESCTFGAIEAQSFRAYAHLKNWVFDEKGNKKPEIVSSLMRETVFMNGSKIEVLGSTPEAVNGPHPQIAHADEIELMRDDTWNESRNMTISKKIKDGRTMNPQDVATSTRKGPSGRVQELIDEIEKAVAEGYKPPRKLYIWCIKETASQQKNCQIANPDLSEKLRCPCDTIRKGEWEDGSPRLLRDVCNGDFYKSRGWQPFSDIVKQFTENDRNTFEVQQLCAKPEMQHHYVPTWRDDKHLIRNFDPDPANGPIFLSVDWGGTNPHAVNWYQLLAFEIEVEAWNQPEDKIITRRLKEGTLVCFGEIYITEIGNEQLGKLVLERESRWAAKHNGFRVYERFADPQGKAARMDWKAMGLPTRWHTTREFDEHIKSIRSMFDDELFVVDGEACPMFVKEIKAWRADPRSGNQIDKFNHCMSNFRYAVANIKKIKQRALSTSNNLPASTTIPRQATVSRTGSTPVGFKGSGNEFDNWRKRLGEPVTRVRD
jgi:hypothetical protein